MRGIVAVCLLAGVAYADPKADIAGKTKAAMESYDMMDYAAATKSLNQALALSKKAKLDKDPVTAKIHLDLGIAAFANGDPDSAKVSFLNALAIDPKIKIDAAYKSADLDKLLNEARAELGGGGTPEPAGDPGVDCASQKGFNHTLIDSTKRGAPQPVEVILGKDIKATKVSAWYRAEGQTQFTEVTLTANGCKYTGAIPAAAMSGSVVHYYVAAYSADNAKPVASKGSAGSPNIMDVTGTAAAPVRTGDNENPLGGGSTATPPVGETPDTGVVGGVEGPSKPPHILIGINAGFGAGYVTGTTETAMEEVKSCCIGSGGAVITGELGYAVNAKLSINLAARVGLPVGANFDGHATLAPAGLLRLRYGFSDSGEGVRVMGQLGVGILRNTIKLDDGKSGMDTDIVAQGPLLIGAGIGFKKNISHAVAFVVDLSVLAGIAVVDSFSSSKAMNSGLTTDLSLGLLFGI